jgi:hypothetical protein
MCAQLAELLRARNWFVVPNGLACSWDATQLVSRAVVASNTTGSAAVERFAWVTDLSIGRTRRKDEGAIVPIAIAAQDVALVLCLACTRSDFGSRRAIAAHLSRVETFTVVTTRVLGRTGISAVDRNASAACREPDQKNGNLSLHVVHARNQAHVPVPAHCPAPPPRHHPALSIPGGRHKSPCSAADVSHGVRGVRWSDRRS